MPDKGRLGLRVQYDPGPSTVHNSADLPLRRQQSEFAVERSWLRRRRLLVTLRRSALQGLDGQRDAFRLRVDIQYLDLHDLTDLHGLGRIFNVAAGQLADVDQSVLMNADIDEGPKLSHVGDHAFQHHSGLHVGDFPDLLVEAGRNKSIARVAPRLAQFFQNVVQRVGPRREPVAIYLLEQSRVLDQLPDGHTQRLRDLFHNLIRLGVDGSHVERIVAVANAQESGGLLKRLRPNARHFFELSAATET